MHRLLSHHPDSPPPKPVSKRFLAVTIDRLQRSSIEQSQFVRIIHSFVLRAGSLAWDDCRVLFWVEHPQQGWQIAV